MDLAIEKLTVKYPRKTVLDNVNFRFRAGQIHALLGENGAGKSTALAVMYGEKIPQEGKILLDGTEVRFSSPDQALAAGISCVHQRPLLANSISVGENLRLAAGFKSWKMNRKKAAALAAEWMPEVRLSALVRNCGGDTRFFAALVCALMTNPGILLLDEPSALLDTAQRNFLYKKLKLLAAGGMNIIIITHSIAEAVSAADTITILAEGKIVAEFSAGKTVPSVIKDILTGNPSRKEKTEIPADTPAAHTGRNSGEAAKNPAIRLEFTGISARPSNRPAVFGINLSAHSGEITLVTGLQENGLGTLEDIITGMADFPVQGKIRIESAGCRSAENSQPPVNTATFSADLARKPLSPYILRKKTGFRIGIIPSDRIYRASNPELSIIQLLTSEFNFKAESERRDFAEKIIRKAQVNVRPEEKCAVLSGGMLQRLILERETILKPQILILCEPLQGLDVQAAGKICSRLSESAAEGCAAVVLAADDFPAGICGQKYSLADGKIYPFSKCGGEPEK